LPPLDAATFWAQFRHDNVAVKSVRLHFVLHGRELPFLTWLFKAKCTRAWTITPASTNMCGSMPPRRDTGCAFLLSAQA
jgi:hypothetical protein